MASKTSYEDKCSILADLWLNYRNDTEFVEFVGYNDLGLPLAYAIDNGLVESTDMARRFVEETFDLLLDGLDIDDEDIAYETLDDMLEDSNYESEVLDDNESDTPSSNNLPERFRDIANGE